MSRPPIHPRRPRSRRSLLLSRAGAAGLTAACLLLFQAAAAAAADWSSFVESSDSSLDPAIVAAFETGDFDTRLTICTAMGRRQDPMAESLLRHLITVTAKGEHYQAEHLLRALLESLFAPEHRPEALQARYVANRQTLWDMEARWDTFADPQLRAVLLRILPLFDPAKARPFLMAAGSVLIERLRVDRGLLPPGETGLVLDFLAAVQVFPDSDFLEPCLSIASLSREKPVIDRARDAAALIRAGMPTRPQPR